MQQCRCQRLHLLGETKSSSFRFRIPSYTVYQLACFYQLRPGEKISCRDGSRAVTRWIMILLPKITHCIQISPRTVQKIDYFVWLNNTISCCTLAAREVKDKLDSLAFCRSIIWMEMETTKFRVKTLFI